MENQFTGKQIPAVSRHTAEERFHLLVDAVQDYAIYMLDCKGNIISWNAGAERIKGYKEVEIVGQHFSLFFTEEDNNRRK
ncbi:MAG: PAS domain S-box protein, partial [Acidobacteria bacterium]|nr:PAS domain S-box protein [Acidobacteriota bacterium]